MSKTFTKGKMVAVPSTSIIPERDIGSTPILECRHLGIDFGGLKAVDDFNLTIGKTEIAGEKAFTLFDTYGFPLDLTELICRENGLTVDEAGFNVEMQKQKERARNAAQVEAGDWVVINDQLEQQFVGYDYIIKYNHGAKLIFFPKMLAI